ncbi:MAG: hypothetical protein C0594_16060 [Marinilabiliales bacterium]|nr:MAG: hypothetical protein C0594_16060 [Marinilabiliales bacterium]
MLNFEDVTLEQIIVHRVGNKLNEEELVLSESSMQLGEELIQNLLTKYFLTAFKSNQFYNFSPPDNLEDNYVFTTVRAVFQDSSQFEVKSKELATHLYNQSNHPNIKSGEFYLVHFLDLVVEGEFVDAIGLFKSENKDTFLKVYQTGTNLEIEHEDGININRLDKGCIVLNTEMDAGYKVCLVDNSSKNNETARYWKSDFLQLEERKDDFYHTHNYLNLCKTFADEVCNSENDIDKVTKADILNKTVSYFKENDSFAEEEFEQKVFNDQKIVDAFQDYKDKFVQESGAEGMGEFDINPDAVKGSQKFFKSVLKLDKNFHVYVHGNRERIEKGFDQQKGLNFYKLFYDNEK